jgi:hypothetical protein
LSTVKNNQYSQALAEKETRDYTHPWGINPIIHLEELRRQSRINKVITLRESLTTMSQSSTTKQKEENLIEIKNTLENLKIMRIILSTLEESDIETATQFGKKIMMITTDLLLRVVKQIGQTNIQTPTLESIIAYIRNLIHTRSAHMRETIPSPLLVTWYELSQLMSSMQNEPELRITVNKAKQLLEIAHDTAAWAYKHLSTEFSDADQIGFMHRNSIPYTYE